MVKATIRISDMSCPACAMRLEMIEDQLPGIKKIEASYRKQSMEVEYDEAQVSRAQLLEAIRKQGYTPVE